MWMNKNQCNYQYSLYLPNFAPGFPSERNYLLIEFTRRLFLRNL